jgi:hypothetical protein
VNLGSTSGSLLRAVPLLFAAACAAEGGDATGDHDQTADQEQDQGGADRFVLAGAATFVQGPAGAAAELHIGFTPAKKPGWPLFAVIPVEYDEQGRSREIAIDPPPEHAGDFLAFTVALDHQGVRRFSNEMFVDPSRPAGTLVRLPLASGAPPPFTGDCFEWSVSNVRAAEPAQRSRGRLSQIFYGYTRASAADYLANRDVPWEDGAGAASADGIMLPHYPFADDRSLPLEMVPLFARVPADRNLVYRPVVVEFGGDCTIDSDTVFQGPIETDALFLEVAPPK